jgi:nucleotide-binding universal stress UspA family protein
MFRKILVPLDGSWFAEQALATAAAVCARAGGASGSIELLLVNTDAFRPLVPEGAQGRVEDRIYVNGIAEEAARLLKVPVSAVVLDGDPVEVIVNRANETGADLIVMTTHGRTGFTRAVMGSVADGVIREAGRPVLLQRPDPLRNWRYAVARGYSRILVPLDGTDDALTIVRPVLDLCRWMEARPTLLQVVFPVVDIAFSDSGVPSAGIIDKDATRIVASRAQDALVELRIDIEADARIPVETVVEVSNDVAKTLIKTATRCRADLVAMATHSRGVTRLVVGSIADRVLRGTNLPLLLLHPQPTGRAGYGAARISANVP